MAISVTEPIGAANDRVARVLFRPFNLGKWFVLGFCAWLASFGESSGGGGSFNSGQSFGRGGGGGGQEISDFFDQAVTWVQANFGLILFFGIIGLLVLIALGLLFTWLGSRGKFMFLDGVVRNRAAVIEPWHRLKTLANSLFWFRVVLGLIGLAAFGLIVVMCLALAWHDIAAREFGPGAIVALIVGGVLLLPFAIVMAIINSLLNDFVIPAMYLHNTRVMGAWGLFRHEIAAGRVGVIVLFYLMKIVLVIVIAIIALVVTCVTCCIAALPYIGTVILLPLFVFMRSYSLYFLQQFGPRWRVFPDDISLAPPQANP